MSDPMLQHIPHKRDSETIILDAITPADIERMVEWYQDADFLRLFVGPTANPLSHDALARWVESRYQSPRIFLFAIRDRQTGLILGLVDLTRLREDRFTGRLGIAIGQPTDRSRGYGSAAIRLILTMAFTELGMQSVQLLVYHYNQRAIRLYRRLGFIYEGVYRAHQLKDGTSYDVLSYTLSKANWRRMTA